MAQDLSGVRARPSQARRSTGAQVSDRGPTTSLQASTPSRPIALNIGGAFFEGAMPGFQQALQNFGQANQMKDQRENEEAKMKARLENAETLENFRREIMTNFDAVKEAVSTGDFGSLSFDVGDMLTRDVVRNNLHQMIGRQQAYEDLPALREELTQTTDPMKLNDVIQKFVALQTQGHQSDFYATAYGETLIAAGRNMAEGRREQLAEAGIERAKSTAFGLRQKELSNPSNSWTLQGLHEATAEDAMALQLAGMSPEAAMLEAAANIDQALIAAVYDNPALDSLLDKPDPSRPDGLSVRQRYPGLVEQTIVARENFYRTETNRIARQRYFDLEQQISYYGDPARSTMTIAMMSDELNYMANNFGEHTKEYQSAYSKYRALLGTTLKDTIDLSLWRQGHFVPTDDKTYNDQAMAAYQALPTMSPDEQANVLSIYAKGGINGKLRQHLEQALKGPPEMREQATRFLMGVKDASKHGDYGEFVGPVAASALHANEYLSEAGLTKREVRESTEAVTANLDPRTYYDQQQLTTKKDGRSPGTQMGRRGSHDLAASIWNSMQNETGINTIGDFDEMPQTIRKMVMDSVNYAAFHLRDRVEGTDPEIIGALAARIAKNQYTYYYNDKGEPIPQLVKGSKIPRAGNKGQDKAMREEAVEFGASAEMYNRTNQFGPRVVETRKDAASMTHGDLVMVDHGNGVPLPSFYTSETVFAVPAENIPPALKDYMISVDEIDGIFHGYIRPGEPGESIALGDGFSLVYEEYAKGWSMRWKPIVAQGNAVDIRDIPTEQSLAADMDVNQTIRDSRNRMARDMLEAEVRSGRITREIANEAINNLAFLGDVTEVQPDASQALDYQHRNVPDTVHQMDNTGQRLAIDDDNFITAIEASIKNAQAASFNATGERPQFIKRSGALILMNEDVKLRSYEDGDGRSIGYGFYLDRSDSRELIENMGYDFQKVYDGEVTISRQDAKKLRDVVMQKELNTLRQRMKNRGIDPGTLKDHQLAALLSIHYQSHSIISTKIYNALKAGDHKKVEQLIREATPKYHGRRSREADVYAGKLSLDLFLQRERERESMPNFGQ